MKLRTEKIYAIVMLVGFILPALLFAKEDSVKVYNVTAELEKYNEVCDLTETQLAFIDSMLQQEVAIRIQIKESGSSFKSDKIKQLVVKLTQIENEISEVLTSEQKNKMEKQKTSYKAKISATEQKSIK